MKSLKNEIASNHSCSVFVNKLCCNESNYTPFDTFRSDEFFCINVLEIDFLLFKCLNIVNLKFLIFNVHGLSRADIDFVKTNADKMRIKVVFIVHGPVKFENEILSSDYCKVIEYKDKFETSKDFRVKLECLFQNLYEEDTYLLKNLTGRYTKVIAVPHLNSIQLIPKKDIVSMNSNGKYTLFHTRNKEVIVSSKNLGEYEKELGRDKNFVRVHHSYIINLDYLMLIDKENGWNCLMNDGAFVKISRSRRREIYELLNLGQAFVERDEIEK